MKIERSCVTSPVGEITLYKLTNSRGECVTLSSLGAGIVSVVVAGRDGALDDVVLGYADPADYMADGPCAGKVPGRFANRIARGHFELDGKAYDLAINNGPNHLHGGPGGFQNLIWDSTVEGDAVVFSRVSPAGEEGYPGTLQVKATYTWSDDSKLTLRLEAVTDAATIVNLTNHAYWNLNGHDSGSCLDHTMQLACSRWLPTDDTLIPTGEMASVESTPMDFLAPKLIGLDIKADFPALVYGKGYDNCWVVDNWEKGTLREVAVLTSEKAGRRLVVSTTQPAAQVYTGNWLAGSPLNKAGRSYNDYDGVAIECQHMPDSPNHPSFPSCTLRPGEKLDETIVFGFSTL